MANSDLITVRFVRQAGVSMATFTGSLWSADEPQSAIPVRAVVAEGQILFDANGSTIAEWPVAEISVRQDVDGYHIRAGTDHVVFHTTQIGFVSAVTGSPSDTVSDRIRATASSRSQPAGGAPTNPAGSGVKQATIGWTSWARLILLASFLFPFLTVTCLGEPAATVSGAQAAFGLEPSVAPEFAGWLAQENDGDGVLLIAVALAAVATVGGFMRRYGRRPLGWMTLGSAAATGYWWFNTVSELAGVDAVGFEVRTEPGLWLVTVGGAVVGVFDLAASPDDSSRTVS